MIQLQQPSFRNSASVLFLTESKIIFVTKINLKALTHILLFTGGLCKSFDLCHSALNNVVLLICHAHTQVTPIDVAIVRRIIATENTLLIVQHPRMPGCFIFRTSRLLVVEHLSVHDVVDR